MVPRFVESPTRKSADEDQETRVAIPAQPANRSRGGFARSGRPPNGSAPAGNRGLRRPVDARRQPGQVAPGAHDLVLRDLRPQARIRGRRPRRPTGYAFLFNSYYNAVGERIARAEPGLLSARRSPRSYRYRAAVDERIEALLGAADEARRAAQPADRARAAPRAAAPGADPHRPEAPVRPQPAPAGLPRAASAGSGCAGSRPSGWVSYPEGCGRSASRATASRSTTSRPGTRSISKPFGWPTGW